METIHFIGYDAVHPADFVYSAQGDAGHFLLIMTQTPARFWTDGGSTILPPYQAALFPPHSHYRYGAAAESYGNDWIIFSSDEAYIRAFPLLGQPFAVSDPEYCHNLFQLLTWEHKQGGSELIQSQLMGILFEKLAQEITRRKPDPYQQELLNLRRNIGIYPQRKWSVADMAAQLHVSAGYLQVLYKRQFGLSCMDDVIHIRLGAARDRLAHTSMSIAQIAALCGYNSAEHFSRQFSRFAGMAPGRYRRLAQEGRDREEPRH